jgi:hypothetical protein
MGGENVPHPQGSDSVNHLLQHSSSRNGDLLVLMYPQYKLPTPPPQNTQRTKERLVDVILVSSARMAGLRHFKYKPPLDDRRPFRKTKEKAVMIGRTKKVNPRP